MAIGKLHERHASGKLYARSYAPIATRKFVAAQPPTAISRDHKTIEMMSKNGG
jgi:hypothetical protein